MTSDQVIWSEQGRLHLSYVANHNASTDGKLKLTDDLKEELVLAIAEAAQNIVKHAYKDVAETKDRMVVRISCNNNLLEISFFDKGKPVEESKVKHRAIDDVKPGGLGTFFIQEIMDSIKFKEGDKPWINNLVLTKKL